VSKCRRAGTPMPDAPAPAKRRTSKGGILSDKLHMFHDEADEQHKKDKEHLAKFGYDQELSRSLGFFSNFAVAFSFISATTGIFGLFYYGLDTGGPAFIWSWPLVFAGQLLVALTFAEVSSHYPLAGGIYQWCKHLLGTTYAWFAAWFYLIALLVTIAAVDFGAAPVITSLLRIEDTRWTLSIIAIVFVVLQTILNLYGVKIMAFVNNIGTVTEIVGMVGVGLLLFGAVLLGRGEHQSLSVVFDRGGTDTAGYLGVFLAAALSSAWVLYGFDSAGAVAEETVNPTREVPRAILTALGATFLVGGFFMLAALVAIPDVEETIGAGADALPFIMNAHLPTWMTDVLLLVVVIAMFVCGLAIQATTARLLFSYGRDGQIPASSFFKRVSKKYQTPVSAIIFTAVFTAVLLVFQSQLARIVAWAVVGIYIPYQMVVIASIGGRLKGWPREKAGFNLGAWGWPINVVALAYGIFMIVNLSWPRTPDAPWYDNYLVPLSVVVAFGLGLLFFFVKSRGGASMELSEPAEATETV
jgi:urea carboxylase system permease